MVDPMAAPDPAAIEFLLNKLQDTKTNAQFFEAMKR